MKPLNPKVILKLATLFAFTSIITGFGDSNSNQQQLGSTAITTNEAMDAENLALAGEQLVGPFTFMLADYVFNQSLEKDPNNKRAQFYQAFLRPLMLTKGLAHRISPLAKEFGYKLQVSQIPNSPFKSFITHSEKSKIKTEAHAQEFLTDLRNAFNEFRKFLKENPDLDLDINLNPQKFSDLIETKNYNSCRKVWEKENGYNDYQCDKSMITKVGMNMADVIALQQAAAGAVLYLTPFTSYKFDGIKNLIQLNLQRQKNNLPLIPPSQIQSILFKKNTFGKLREDQSMTTVVELGSDFSAAWKFVNDSQYTLCPNRQATDSAQRHHTMVESGICVGDIRKSQNNLHLMDRLMSGIIRLIIKKANGERAEVSIDAIALIRNPVNDLRMLAPRQYNQPGFGQCQLPVVLKDETINGVFPDANASSILLTESCQ